jgi:hypothetical protein
MLPRAALFILALLAAPRAEAAGPYDRLSELAIFNRCYAHLTQLKLPLNHPLRAAVAAGTKTAAAACMEVLTGSQLQASGASQGRLGADTAEARAVLRTFNDFHRSWFPTDNMAKAITLGDLVVERNGQVHDMEEAALHVTRALLTPGVSYSDVSTHNVAMEALRTNGPSNYDAAQPAERKIKHYSSPDAYDPSLALVDLNAQLVQTGELVGIRPMSLNPTKNDKVANSTTVPLVSSSLGQKYVYYNRSIRLHESLGAGAVGTQSYLLLNLGRQDTQPTDGGMRMVRRWAQSVYKDLLCRDMPTLRLADALPYVQNSPTSKTPPFRKSGTCMACHASMDPMAAAARNVSYAFTYAPAYGGIVSLYYWPATRTAETGVVEEDWDYYARPTTGRLLYRSYDGTLVDHAVTGVDGLGDELAKTNDLYVCAAARYFRYFTGIGVNLQDSGDTSKTPLSTAETTYRNLVIGLGQELKTHQSLKALIQSIISSPLYGRQSMREGAP